MENLEQRINEFTLQEEDRVVGALCYPGIIPVIIPIVILLAMGKDKKSVKFHAVQGICSHLSFVALWMVGFAILFLLSFLTFGLGAIIAVPLLFLFMLSYLGITCYWGYKIYSGENLVLPYITDFVLKNMPKD
jgi:uncharacterized membrane protein